MTVVLWHPLDMRFLASHTLQSHISFSSHQSQSTLEPRQLAKVTYIDKQTQLNILILCLNLIKFFKHKRTKTIQFIHQRIINLVPFFQVRQKVRMSQLTHFSPASSVGSLSPGSLFRKETTPACCLYKTEQHEQQQQCKIQIHLNHLKS